MLWTVVLLTLPQLLSWIAAQGITVPSGSGGVGTSWLASMGTIFKNFVNQIVVAKLSIFAPYDFVDEATANAVECLVNLLYLIRLRAAVPTDVLLSLTRRNPSRRW